MASGAYVALSGLRTRMEQLDRLAADMANAETTGYKSERVTSVTAERAEFANVLQTAIDVAPSPGHLDFRAGVLVPSGRDLDVAIDGPGFFTVDTPGGVRYTRNGQFSRSPDGTLKTLDGMTVLGEDGPIKLGPGEVSIDIDGTIRTDKIVAGRLKIANFADLGALDREGGTRFKTDVTPGEMSEDARIRGGALEQSNVSMTERIAQLTDVARSFEGLQRGLSLLMNDVYGRAITELGRR